MVRLLEDLEPGSPGGNCPWGTLPRTVCGHLQSLVPPKTPGPGQTISILQTPSTSQTSLSCAPECPTLSLGSSTSQDLSI